MCGEYRFCIVNMQYWRTLLQLKGKQTIMEELFCENDCFWLLTFWVLHQFFKKLLPTLKTWSKREQIIRDIHCVKRVRIWSYSDLHFPAYGLNTERYSVSLPIQSKCRKMWTRITTNTDTFYAVFWSNI